MSQLHFLPCLDSEELAIYRQRELDISREAAVALGRSAEKAAREGFYFTRDGHKVDWYEAVQASCTAKVSLCPDVGLPGIARVPFTETRVQVTNETTLGASLRLIELGLRPLALNFANGLHPGGGFLNGAVAQEEALCRSSALYQTLVGDPMYEAHARRRSSDSSDWAIYSPAVPVFRNDDGTALEQPWLLSFISCAAPYAHGIGQPRAGDLLQKRIHRVLAIAEAYGYATLVLGAWGCGAFKHDPLRTARDFRHALETDYSGAFSEVVFAITDWTPGRKFLGPFRDIFTVSGSV